MSKGIGANKGAGYPASLSSLGMAGKRNHRPEQEKTNVEHINLTIAIVKIYNASRRCINFASAPSPPDEDLSKGKGIGANKGAREGQEEVLSSTIS